MLYVSYIWLVREAATVLSVHRNAVTMYTIATDVFCAPYCRRAYVTLPGQTLCQLVNVNVNVKNIGLFYVHISNRIIIINLVKHLVNDGLKTSIIIINVSLPVSTFIYCHLHGT